MLGFILGSPYSVKPIKNVGVQALNPKAAPHRLLNVLQMQGLGFPRMTGPPYLLGVYTVETMILTTETNLHDSVNHPRPKP